MAAWSSTANIQLSHQECERADVTKFDGAPPLCFTKPAVEAGPEETNLKAHQVKIKVNDTFVYYNLFLNGLPELVLNHVIIFHDLIKKLGLNELVTPSNSLLLVKNKPYAALAPNTRKVDQKKVLEEEITALRHDISEMHKKRFSLFKKLLHETIQKDWEKVILD